MDSSVLALVTPGETTQSEMLEGATVAPYKTLPPINEGKMSGSREMTHSQTSLTNIKLP
jgi:hypothetical protein